MPTYDVSCQAGGDGGCPYGSVHQPHKQEIGARLGEQLVSHLIDLTKPPEITEGPLVTGNTVVARSEGNGGTSTGVTVYQLDVDFGGSVVPFRLAGTRNCTTLPGHCCDGSANGNHTIDFDASHDGGLT